MTQPTRSLLRHPDFLKLWTAETISQFGTQVSLLAIPLVAVTLLNVTPFEVGAARDHRVPAVHPVQPAGRRLGRPAAPAADPHRRRHRAGGDAAVHPDRVRLRRPDDLAAVRRRVRHRGADRLLRRRVPVLPAVARRPRPARRGQLEAGDHPHAGPDRGSGVGRRPHRAPDRADRHPGRLDQLRGLGVLRVPDPAPGAHAGSRTSTSTARPARDCARRSPIGLRYVLGNRYLRGIAAATGTSNLFSQIAFATFIVYAVRELRPVADRDRHRLRRRERRGPARGVHRRSVEPPVRAGPHDRRGDGAHGAGLLLVALAPDAGADPVPRRRDRPRRASRASSTTSTR